MRQFLTLLLHKPPSSPNLLFKVKAQSLNTPRSYMSDTHCKSFLPRWKVQSIAWHRHKCITSVFMGLSNNSLHLHHREMSNTSCCIMCHLNSWLCGGIARNLIQWRDAAEHFCPICHIIYKDKKTKEYPRLTLKVHRTLKTTKTFESSCRQTEQRWSKNTSNSRTS